MPSRCCFVPISGSLLCRYVADIEKCGWVGPSMEVFAFVHVAIDLLPGAIASVYIKIAFMFEGFASLHITIDYMFRAFAWLYITIDYMYEPPIRCTL